MMASSARQQRARGGRGRRRQGAPHDYWRHPDRPKGIGREQFRVVAHLGDKSRHRPLNAWVTGLVESVSWDDSKPVLTGQVVFRQPERAVPHAGRHRPPYRLDELPFGYGDRIGLYGAMQGGRGWVRVWEMAVGLDSELQASGGQLTLSLEDPAARLRRSRDDWSYRQGENHHRDGWTAHGVTISVLRRYQVPKGQLVTSTYRMRKLTMRDASPLEVIQEAWSRTRRHTGRRYVISAREGRVSVLPERRPKHMLLIGQYVADATKSFTTRGDFATVMTGKGRVRGGGGDKGHKASVRVASRSARKRHGLIHRIYHPAEAVGSEAELRRQTKRALDKSRKPKRELTFTHPGIAGLRRGDACLVEMPELGLRRLIFVKGVQHSLAAGAYTVEVTAGWTDPYRHRDHRDRRDRAQGRGRPGGGGQRAHAQPKRGERRAP